VTEQVNTSAVLRFHAAEQGDVGSAGEQDISPRVARNTLVRIATVREYAPDVVALDIFNARSVTVRAMFANQTKDKLDGSNLTMNTCRYCGEEIVPAEFSPLFGKKRKGWVHAKSDEESAWKCMVCGNVYLNVRGGLCTQCGQSVAMATVHHRAEP